MLTGSERRSATRVLRLLVLIATVALTACSSSQSDLRPERSQHRRTRSPTDSPVASTTSPSPPAVTTTADDFKTTDGEIECHYERHVIVCDLLDGLTPPPAIDCETAPYELAISSAGGATTACAPHRLAYEPQLTLAEGERWSEGGIVCDAVPDGIQCSNSFGHGFAMSNVEWDILRPTTAPALRSDGFVMPSNNIACFSIKRTLRCDILSGLVPEPDEPCELDWVGVFLTAKLDGGGVQPDCAGDTVFGQEQPTLQWGSVWRGPGLTCDSRESGLTCWDAFGRGFTLAKAGWNTFASG